MPLTLPLDNGELNKQNSFYSFKFSDNFCLIPFPHASLPGCNSSSYKNFTSFIDSLGVVFYCLPKWRST